LSEIVANSRGSSPSSARLRAVALRSRDALEAHDVETREPVSGEGPSGGPSLGPTLQFMQRVWQLNHALEHLSSRMDRHLGVTAQQRLIVRCVGAHGQIAAGELATTLRVDPGTVSAALNRLEAKGLVTRVRDRKDLRRVMVALTERGRAMDVPQIGTVENGVQRMLDEVAPGDVETAVRVLARLSDLFVSEARACGVDHGDAAGSES
jgi:DNA-binding MarR family transcriptional regulator